MLTCKNVSILYNMSLRLHDKKGRIKNEQKKYEVIKELVDHNGNKNLASKKIGISRRQIDRLIIKYKKTGKSAFVHGNRSKNLLML